MEWQPRTPLHQEKYEKFSCQNWLKYHVIPRKSLFMTVVTMNWNFHVLNRKIMSLMYKTFVAMVWLCCLSAHSHFGVYSGILYLLSSSSMLCSLVAPNWLLSLFRSTAWFTNEKMKCRSKLSGRLRFVAESRSGVETEDLQFRKMERRSRHDILR